MTTETWMPVSNTFRAYPLVVEILPWEDPCIRSKGHHDPAEFLLAAIEEWAEQDGYDNLILYRNNTWERLAGPLWAPPRLRRPEFVRHEWWATRCMAPLDGYAYYTNQVAPHERGAYPVTVVDL